jgi:hypothetical protein
MLSSLIPVGLSIAGVGCLTKSFTLFRSAYHMKQDLIKSVLIMSKSGYVIKDHKFHHVYKKEYMRMPDSHFEDFQYIDRPVNVINNKLWQEFMKSIDPTIDISHITKYARLVDSKWMSAYNFYQIHKLSDSLDSADKCRVDTYHLQGISPNVGSKDDHSRIVYQNHHLAANQNISDSKLVHKAALFMCAGSFSLYMCIRQINEQS